MDEMKYAGIFRRFAAFFVDSLCILMIYMFLGLVLGIQIVMGQLMTLPLFGLWWFGGIFLVSWIYYAAFESSSLQATLGKKILGLKVLDQQGQRIGFWRATARYFGKILSRLLLCIGFLMILFTKKKQALHDKLASTIVVEI